MTEQEYGAMLPALLLVVPLVLAVIDFAMTKTTTTTTAPARATPPDPAARRL